MSKLSPEQKKKLMADMVDNRKKLPTLLAKIRPEKEGRFAFVMSSTGAFYALLVDPKSVSPKLIEVAKKSIGKGAVVRRGILEHTATGPFIFWTAAALPPLTKALTSGGLKSVKPLGKATVQLLSKERAEALTAEVGELDGTDDPLEDGEIGEMDETDEEIDLSDVELDGTDELEPEDAESEEAERQLLQDEYSKESVLLWEAEQKRLEHEYAQLNLKGIEDRAKLLEEEYKSAEKLPNSDPNRQATLDRLTNDLDALAQAQQNLEESIRQVNDTKQQLMVEIEESRTKSQDMCAKFALKEQKENAKKTEKLLAQKDEDWQDTIETMKALQQEKDGLQQGVEAAGRLREELAQLTDREGRQSIERDVLKTRVEMLEAKGAKPEKLIQPKKELKEAEERLAETVKKREETAGNLDKIQKDEDKTKLALLEDHAETNALIDSRADQVIRGMTVKEAKRSIEDRQEAEKEAADLRKQEDDLMKQLPPSLPDATKEWSKLVAMLNELKAERELLDSQSGFFKRYTLFSATRKRASAAKERLPEVDEQIRLLEEQVRRAQEKVTSARQGGDPAIQKQLDEIRVKRSGADKVVAEAKLHEADIQTYLRQQEATAAAVNRDLRKQAVDQKMGRLQARDPDLQKYVEDERVAKDELKRGRDAFATLQRREEELRAKLTKYNDDLLKKIDEVATTPQEIAARDAEIARLREAMKKDQVGLNDLLVRRKINATDRKVAVGKMGAAKKNAENRIKSLAGSGDADAAEIQAGLEQLAELEKLDQGAKSSAELALKTFERTQVEVFVARQNSAAEEERAALEAQIREDWALIGRVHNDKFQVDLMTEDGRNRAKKELGDDYPKLEQMQWQLETKVNKMLIKGASPLEIKKILGSVPNNILPLSLRGEIETWQQMQANLDPSTDVLAAESMFQSQLEKERLRTQNATPEAVQGKFEAFTNAISGVVGGESEILDEGMDLVGEGTELLATVNDSVKGSLELAEAIRSIGEAGGALSKAEFQKRLDEIWGMVTRGKFVDVFKSEDQEEMTKEGLAKQLEDGTKGAELAEKILGGTGLALEILGDVRGIAAWHNEKDVDKKAEMEDAFFEKVMSLGSGVTGFVGSFLDQVPVLGVVSSTLSLIANASARKWHNRYVALGQQAARLVGDALATAFEEAMVREKQLLSRYVAKVAADVTAIAAGIVSMATGATGIGAAVGAAMAIGAGVVKLGTKLGSWIVDKWQMRGRKQLEERAKDGDMEARVQLFREHPKYAKTMIAQEAMKGNGFAKAYCHGHGLSKSMLGKMDEAELTKTLLERHEQANYFEEDNTALEQMAALAKETATALGKLPSAKIEAGDKKAATKLCQSWLEAVQDAEALDTHRRSFLAIIDKHQAIVEDAPPDDQPAMLAMLDDFTVKLQVCVEALRTIYAKSLDVLTALRTVPSVPDLGTYKDRATLLTAALAGI